MAQDSTSWFLLAEKPTLTSPLQFVQELAAVFDAASPPPFSFFLTLPLAIDATWGIYACCLVKPGQKPRLYIGSGTNATLGLLGRTSIDKNGTAHSQLPRFVVRALEDGYTIANVGTLCWISLPTVGLQPRARSLVMALEAAFSLIFHAITPMVTDAYVEDLMFRPREAVEWAPLCSHPCLQEAIRGDLYMTAEELEAVAAVRAARLKENANKRSQKHRAKKRAEDLDGYREKGCIEKNTWADNNRERNNATAARTRDKAESLQRFYCDDCDVVLEWNGRRLQESQLLNIDLLIGGLQLHESATRSRNLSEPTKTTVFMGRMSSTRMVEITRPLHR